MKRFERTTAIVTGGGNGIGAAICERLCQEGATVLVADIDVEAAKTVAQRLTDAGCRAEAFEVDASKEQQVQQMVQRAVELGGGQLHTLVNNAARFVFADADKVTEEQWDTVLSTNVKGYSFCIKHAAKAMKSNSGSSTEGGGSIINIASISSFIAQPGFVPYSTTKAAILQLSRCSALDLGPRGIRVNAVCPGPILTDGTRRHADSQGKTIEEVTAEMNSQMIIRRMGDPAEVAAAVAFLASSDASFITGTTLMVDGGYTAL